LHGKWRPLWTTSTLLGNMLEEILVGISFPRR
jgi:hypothetical protein